MSKSDRQAVVETLTESFKESPNLYLTDFTGLDVAGMTELRRRCREAGVKYLVVKNTLALRAFQAIDLADMAQHLTGPTGMLLAGENAVAGAKVLSDFAKEHDKPAIKVGLLDGKAVTKEEVEKLAKLPSREQLLSQLAGTLQGPVAGLLGAMNGLLYQVVGALEALKAQRSADS